ncbi:hypothetical protein ACYRFT_01490 [Listeria kieliensis]
MATLQTILLILILAGLTFVGYWLKEMPKIFNGKMMEKFRRENEKDIQREAFFRQLKGDDLADSFSQWVSAIIELDSFTNKMNGKDGEKLLYDMQKKALMYGSEQTVIVLSVMFQHMYQSNAIENRMVPNIGKNNKKEQNGSMLMVFISYLIANLKFDFTGYRIDPLDVLKLKIRDYYKTEKDFLEAKKSVEEKLKDAGYKI